MSIVRATEEMHVSREIAQRTVSSLGVQKPQSVKRLHNNKSKKIITYLKKKLKIERVSAAAAPLGGFGSSRPALKPVPFMR